MSNASANYEKGVLLKLAELEKDFHKAEIKVLQEQNRLLKPLYDQRSKICSEMPRFWAIAIDQADEGISEYISPEDSQVLDHLKGLTVERPFDDPRDLKITFEFAQNEFLADDSLVLSKEFHVVDEPEEDVSIGEQDVLMNSKPVKINWKRNPNASAGSSSNAKGKSSAEAGEDDNNTLSFFDWFEWTEMDDDPATLPGNEVATFIAEDLYPNAVKYFTDALVESDEEEDASVDLEGGDEDDEAPQVQEGASERPAKKQKQ